LPAIIATVFVPPESAVLRQENPLKMELLTRLVARSQAAANGGLTAVTALGVEPKAIENESSAKSSKNSLF
jgi:hypothetical protein